MRSSFLPIICVGGVTVANAGVFDVFNNVINTFTPPGIFRRGYANPMAAFEPFGVPQRPFRAPVTSFLRGQQESTEMATTEGPPDFAESLAMIPAGLLGLLGNTLEGIGQLFLLPASYFDALANGNTTFTNPFSNISIPLLPIPPLNTTALDEITQPINPGTIIVALQTLKQNIKLAIDKDFGLYDPTTAPIILPTPLPLNPFDGAADITEVGLLSTPVNAISTLPLIPLAILDVALYHTDLQLAEEANANCGELCANLLRFGEGLRTLIRGINTSAAILLEAPGAVLLEVEQLITNTTTKIVDAADEDWDELIDATPGPTIVPTEDPDFIPPLELIEAWKQFLKSRLYDVGEVVDSTVANLASRVINKQLDAKLTALTGTPPPPAPTDEVEGAAVGEWGVGEY